MNKKPANFFERIQQRIYQHPLVERSLQWTKDHSLPGFFRVPIYDVVTFVLRELKRDSLFTRANSVAYSFFLSLFPSILVLFTLIPYLKYFFLQYLPEGENFEQLLQNEIQKVMPGVAGERLFNFIDDITSNPRVGLLSVGFFLAAFFASNGMLNLMRGFEKSYSITFKNRGALRKRWVAILLTFQLSGLVIASVLLIILGKLAIGFLSNVVNLDQASRILLNSFRWLSVIGLFYTSIAIIYRYGAATRRRFRFFTPGAALSSLLCLIVSVGFSAYVNNFNTYNELYGSIGTIIVIMLWLQMNSLFLLIGYELNASIAVNRDRREEITEDHEVE